ncbi:MAG: hypothetical protein HC915_05085 [Anaerolineae bacterium]|nr:hypothetical protein [Anaerolineae bacterium]
MTYYRLNDGSYTVWGDCQNSQCRQVAGVNPNILTSLAPGASRIYNAGSTGWFVSAYALGEDSSAGEVAQAYFLSVFNGSGGLVQDGFTILRFADNTTAWRAKLCPTPSLRTAITATGGDALDRCHRAHLHHSGTAACLHWG